MIIFVHAIFSLWLAILSLVEHLKGLFFGNSNHASKRLNLGKHQSLDVLWSQKVKLLVFVLNHGHFMLLNLFFHLELYHLEE